LRGQEALTPKNLTTWVHGYVVSDDGECAVTKAVTSCSARSLLLHAANCRSRGLSTPDERRLPGKDALFRRVCRVTNRNTRKSGRKVVKVKTKRLDSPRSKGENEQIEEGLLYSAVVFSVASLELSGI